MKCPIPDCEEELYHPVYICASKHQAHDLVKEMLSAQSSAEVFRLLSKSRQIKIDKLENALERLKEKLGKVEKEYLEYRRLDAQKELEKD